MTTQRGQATRSTFLRTALAAAALASAGCHPRQPLPVTSEGEWAVVRDAATRRFVLYDGLDHRATATATHLSLPVREARARRLAEWLGWTEQELAARLAQERSEYAAGEEFLLSFYTADSRWQDLDGLKSVWRIALKVDGADVLASKVTSVDPDANLVNLFPYVGPFETVYRILVPRPPSGEIAGKAFVLELASGLGKISLEFGQTPPEKPVDHPGSRRRRPELLEVAQRQHGVPQPAVVGLREVEQVVEPARLLPLARTLHDQHRDVRDVAQLEEIARDQVLPVVLADLPAEQRIRVARALEPLRVRTIPT